MRGSSKVELDKETVNILLKEFASKPDSEVTFENGRLFAHLSGLKVEITNLPLNSTKLNLEGSFGKVDVELSDFLMEANGVKMNFEIEVD